MQDHWQISWLVFFFFFCYRISESFTIKFLSSDEVIDMFMYRVISFVLWFKAGPLNFVFV